MKTNRFVFGLLSCFMAIGLLLTLAAPVFSQEGELDTPTETPSQTQPAEEQQTQTEEPIPFIPTPSDTPEPAVPTESISLPTLTATFTTTPTESLPLPTLTATFTTTPTDVFESSNLKLLALTFGQTTQGSISHANEIDSYTFFANAGDKVLVRMAKTSGALQPKIRVNNPNGTKLCEKYSTVTAEIASCTITRTGMHTILASDNNGTATGVYFLYLQRLNNPGSRVAITFGSTLSRTITKPAEMDTYTFFASAGDKVLVRMTKTSGGLWPEISIYRPDGKKLCTAFSSGSAKIASCTLTSSGRHTILASANNDITTGAYSLFLQRLNNPGSRVAITFGSTLSRSINKPAEMDTYTFFASAGDKVLFRMTKASGDLWPEITIYGPDGKKLCTAFSSGSAKIASCTLTSNGTYTILAYDNSGTFAGTYYIHLQRLNNPGSPTAIPFGGTLSASIDTPAEMDAYTFSANAGDKVLVRMTKASGDLWPGIKVYGPDGVMLCEAFSVGSAKIASCTLTSNGTYTILAHDDSGTYAGAYYIHLQRLNNPGSPTAIPFGGTLSASIDTPAEMDAYTFSATAGDKVLVRMTKASGDLWPGIKVYGPDGVMLCEAFSVGSAKIASCTLTSDGTYTILAHDDSGTFAGTYYIHLQRLNNPGSPTAIPFGGTLSASIDTPAEMDAYTFSANAGDKVLVRMTKASGDLWPGIKVYGPDGVMLCEAFSVGSAKIASCTLTSDGTYTILAHDDSGTFAGTYYIHLQRLNNPGNPTAIPFGGTLSASIDTPSEMDAYTFSASVSDSVNVEMEKVSGALWPEIKVYGPDGVMLCEAFSVGTAKILDCSLTSNGTYTILAYDTFGTGIGQYKIKLY